MSQAAKTPRTVRVDTLLDKGERYIIMQNLTPTQAARKVMPDDLLAISLGDLRDLAVMAIADRLAARLTAHRTNHSVRASELSRKYVEEALAAMSEQVKQRAAVLARVSYFYDGARVSLLDMPIEGHVARRARVAQAEVTLTEARKFHTAAIKALRDAKVERITDLPTQRIVDLGILAAKVWGE